MFSPVEFEDLKYKHNYFVKEGPNLYFGMLVSKTDDSIKIWGSLVYMNLKRYARESFIKFSYICRFQCYTYVPFKMEEIMLNKILKQLLGDDFSYPFNPTILFS
jgi:hypothetical protein